MSSGLIFANFQGAARLNIQAVKFLNRVGLPASQTELTKKQEGPSGEGMNCFKPRALYIDEKASIIRLYPDKQKEKILFEIALSVYSLLEEDLKEEVIRRNPQKWDRGGGIG